MTGPRIGSLALTEGQLAAALGTLAEAVTVQGADGEMRFANQAALDLLGFGTLEDFLSADPSSLMERYRRYAPDGTPVPAGDLPGGRVLQGEHVEPELVRWVDATAGELRWALIKATPLLDDDGTPVGAVNVIEDVTGATDAAVSRRVLDEAARSLASSLDYEQTLQHVARLAVPTLADWCSVDLLAERRRIREVAVAHVDPQQLRVARDLRARYPPSPDGTSGVASVLRGDGTVLAQDVSEDDLVAMSVDEEHLAALRELRLGSMLIVPLEEVSGRVIGTLTLVLSDRARRFTDGDVALAEELGRRARAAVHNARLYTERGEIAHVLQASMLPLRLPQMPGWRTALRHRAEGEANEVGGDLYDIQAVGNGRWLVLVGDVVGKGAPAAALTPRVRHTIAAATALTGDPRHGMQLLDRVLEAEPEPERVLCTAASVVLEEQPGRPALARIVCAGHPSPILVRDGTAHPVGAAGRMLGLPEAEGGRPHEDVELRRGDALLLFTDGVTEAGAGEDRFGVERLCAALEGAGPGADAQALVDAVRDALATFEGGTLHDDALLLAVQRV
jgi:serine phosphatase RsbU (regulator of sigma subunit)